MSGIFVPQKIGNILDFFACEQKHIFGTVYPSFDQVGGRRDSVD